MADAELGLLQGTLDLLILKVLAWGPQHGYSIARWIKRQSDDALVIEDRALYLALHRLEAGGSVESEWGVSDNNRKAKYYSITPAGRRQLKERISHWTSYAAAVAKIIHGDRPATT